MNSMINHFTGPYLRNKGVRKIGYLTLLLFLYSGLLNAGSMSFPINEKGKITYQNEVRVDALSADALRLNMINYAAKASTANKKKSAKPKLEKNSLSKEVSFYVYTQGLFTPQIHGEISFNINIEINESGYSYTVTDFMFQHYQRNRHGQYAPVRGKYKPLEEEKYAGMQSTWEEHKALTRKVVENHISDLKKNMQEVPAGSRFTEEW